MLLAGLMLVLGGVALPSMPAIAEEGSRYVSAASGVDEENDCASETTPCATMGHTLAQAAPGDIIEVADGVYTEVLAVTKDVTLRRLGGPGAAGAVVLQACAVSQVAAPCPDEAGRQPVITAESVSLTLQDVTVRHGGNTSSLGGAVSIEDGHLTLTRARIVWNVAEGGGGVAGLDATISVTDTTIDHNTADLGGGIYADSTAVSITNSSVSTNEASLAGGGIYADTGAVVTATGSVISSNKAAMQGGGIYLYEASATIDSGSIVSTNLAMQGGGIYSDDGPITVTNSTVSLNESQQGGAGLYAYFSVMTMINAVVSGNEAGQSGGGIYAHYGTVTITDTVVSANEAAQRGGGIYTSSAELILDGVTVSENRAVGNGGGILGYYGTLTITDSIISENQAQYGGGVLVDKATATVTSATLTKNTAQFNGGGMHVQDATSTVMDSTVSWNTAGGGGGLSATGGTLTVEKSLILSNGASQNGGGISFGGATVVISDSRVAENTTGGNGGGIEFQSGQATLTNVLVEANTAAQAGGGISLVRGGNLRVTDSRIVLNQANQGGGIRGDMQSGIRPSLRIIGTEVSGNTATTEGGGITGSGALRIAGSMVAGNGAQRGGGIYRSVTYDTTHTSVTHSAIAGNTASDEGPQLYVAQAAGNLSFSNNWWGTATPSVGAHIYMAPDQPGTLTLAPWFHSVSVEASTPDDLADPSSVVVTLYTCDDDEGTCDPPAIGSGHWSIPGDASGDLRVRFTVGDAAPVDVPLAAGSASIDVPSAARGQAVTTSLLFGGVASTLGGSVVPTWDVPAGPPAYATLTAGAACDQTMASVVAGEDLPVCITLHDADGFQAEVTGTYDVEFGGLAQGQVDGTSFSPRRSTAVAGVSVDFEDGRGSVTLSSTLAATGLTLHAEVSLDDGVVDTDDGDGPGQGLALTVTHAAAHALALGVSGDALEGQDYLAGETLATVDIEVRDEFDNLVATGPGASLAVTATLTLEPGALRGDTTVAAQDGQATFSTLSVDTTTDYAMYSIRFSTDGLPGDLVSGSFTVTYTPSDDASLAAFTVSPGVLEPAFSPEVTAYAVTVDHDVTSVTVGATPTHEGASVVIDGAADIDVGENTVTATVTAEDGTTTRAYTVTVTRAEPPAPGEPTPTPSDPAPPRPSSGDPMEDLVQRTNQITTVAVDGRPTGLRTHGADGSMIEVTAPAGVLPQGTALTAAAVANLPDLVEAAGPPAGADMVLAFVVEARNVGGDALREFSEPVELTITVPASLMPAELPASTLVLTFWDGSEWVEVLGTVTAHADGSFTMTASVDHFTVFTVFQQPGRGQFTAALPARGLGLTMWSGGGYALLDTALGQGRSTWVTSGGRWHGYQPGAPVMVNAGFVALYPEGIPSGTAMVVVTWR